MKKKIVRQGRTVKENIKSPIAVTGLKIGMYVCELDRPWLETPFILQGFYIESHEEIETISKHCEFVYIDETKDSWQEAELRSVGNSPGSRKPTYSNTATNKQEVHRARSIHQNTRQLTRNFMDDVRLGRAIDINEIKKNVSECVSSVLRNPDAMMWLSKIRQKDEYTSEHSVNVGLLAITFGRHLGLSEDDLNKIGMAGMLHDVGKMRTPIEILNKEDPLTAEEFDIMKSHAQHGHDILMAHKNIYHGTVDVAYGHHEALDGSGYPRQLKAASISEFTRIVTLCDIYDAITSDRVYHAGRSSLEALKILYQNKGTKYDDRLVTEFISCIGLYPPGSVVELNSGAVGIVISTNYRNRHLPKILLLRDENKMPLPEKIVTLERVKQSEIQNQMIKTVLPNGSNGIRIEKFIEKGLILDG